MKRLALLFLLTALPVYSQTYYLNVWSKGQLTSIPVTEINRVVFANITAVEDAPKEQAVINTFELYQNYPNPFNPSTTIQYQIKNAGQVKVQIYNINGELVRTLTDTDQAVGSYSVTWNGRDNNNRQVASGMYIYRVMSGTSILSKKMMLLK